MQRPGCKGRLIGLENFPDSCWPEKRVEVDERLGPNCEIRACRTFSSELDSRGDKEPTVGSELQNDTAWHL